MLRSKISPKIKSGWPQLPEMEALVARASAAGHAISEREIAAALHGSREAMFVRHFVRGDYTVVRHDLSTTRARDRALLMPQGAP
jgi:hypothetical protein